MASSIINDIVVGTNNDYIMKVQYFKIIRYYVKQHNKTQA
jgi:hypothetical protein